MSFWSKLGVLSALKRTLLCDGHRGMDCHDYYDHRDVFGFISSRVGDFMCDVPMCYSRIPYNISQAIVHISRTSFLIGLGSNCLSAKYLYRLAQMNRQCLPFQMKANAKSSTTSPIAPIVFCVVVSAVYCYAK